MKLIPALLLALSSITLNAQTLRVVDYFTSTNTGQRLVVTGATNTVFGQDYVWEFSPNLAQPDFLPLTGFTGTGPGGAERFRTNGIPAGVSVRHFRTRVLDDFSFAALTLPWDNEWTTNDYQAMTNEIMMPEELKGLAVSTNFPPIPKIPQLPKR